MSAFADGELRYLRGEHRLARLATVRKDGTPHVTPVGWTYNAEHDTIDIDDVVSVSPWKVRGVEIRGRAETVHQPAPLIRIHPERIRSWGLEMPER